MRAVIQRVARARVTVEGDTVGEVDRGLLVLVGVAPGDSKGDVEVLADKLAGLRIFADDEGRMNLSVQDVDGGILVVSQFTLYGDTWKGRRPSFIGAGKPEDAEPLVEMLVERLGALGVTVATGRFGAMMAVELLNDGPVTLVVDVKDGRIV